MSRRFYVVAVSAGFAFANMAMAVPLRVVQRGAHASLAGDVLAAATISVAAGALLAGRAGRGRRSLLGTAVAVTGAGSTLLLAATDVPLLTAGACVVGAGVGVFWVASQLVLAQRAGSPAGARAFLLHYALYTLGAVAGSSTTGALASAAPALGLQTTTGIRASSSLALGGCLLAASIWRAAGVAGVEPRPMPQADRVPERQLRLQVPDLLLVTGLALLLPLAPVVLAREFGLAPLDVGLVIGAVALAKIAGTFVARALTRSSGPGRTILLLLAAGTTFSLLLTAAPTLPLFVVALLATALAGTGAWPLVVDAAQARAEPEDRRRLAVHWNAREYVLIAAATAASGWLLTELGSPAPVFALAALLFAAAAAAAALQLRRPIRRPLATG
jgi:MFS family permease